MRRIPGNILRPLCVSVAVAFLTYAAVFITSSLLFPVKEIHVDGVRMVPRSEVFRAIPGHTSLLTLNSWTLERQLKSNPWVEGVAVSRNWDSGIVTVEVEERSAVFDGVMDGRRVVLSSDATELPGAGGADLETVRLDEDRLEEVERALKVLQNSDVRLDSVDEVGPAGITASVRGRTVMLSGRVEEEQVRALGRLLRERPEAGSFDLRSPNRVVVAPPKG